MRVSLHLRIFVRNAKYFRSSFNVTNPLLVGNGASRISDTSVPREYFALASPSDSLERASQIGGESSILCSLQAAIRGFSRDVVQVVISLPGVSRVRD